MAMVRDRSLLDADGNISNKLLFSCIKEHKQEVEKRLKLLNDYYDGEHEIKNRRFKNKNIPNNKIVCNHAEYISDLSVGYVFGVPISYTGDGSDVINDNFTVIDEDSHNNELALDLSIFGIGYELLSIRITKSVKVTLKVLYL